MRGRAPSFGEVLGVGEFRALWAAELLSVVGDQLARVALAVLVFQQTSSAALSALTYALTFAPAVLGGALLSGLADRFPRRRVLVTTDLLRAALAGAMAVPNLPLPALWALVGVLSMSAAPFKAAQLALLPQVLTGERYVVGLSLRQITGQSAQLAGFASGGLLLTAVEPHIALALNAATFLASALLIVLGVRPRAAAITAAGPVSKTAPLAGNRRLLPVVVLMSIAGLFVVPEGVAAPYGAAIGTGSVGVGLLMAADPLGSVVGAWLIARIRLRPSPTSVILLAAGSGLPLLLCAPGPGLAFSMLLWATSGALSTAYLIKTQAIVVEMIPDHRRGRVMGRIATCLYTSQGLAIVSGGIAAEATGPFRAVAGAGLLGAVLALCVGAWWRPVARSRRDLVAGSERGPLGEAAITAQSSLLATGDTSCRGAHGGTQREAMGSQSSLFATTNTSRQHLDTKQDLALHSSLFATTNTSSYLDTGPDPARQSSLFRTTNTSQPLGTEPDLTVHSSLFATASTSHHIDAERDPAPQSSLFATTNTSSYLDTEPDPTDQSSLFATTTTSRHLDTGPNPARQSSLFRTTNTSQPLGTEQNAALQSSLFATTGTSQPLGTKQDFTHQSSLFANANTSSHLANQRGTRREAMAPQSSLFATTNTSRQLLDTEQNQADQSSLFATTSTSSHVTNQPGTGTEAIAQSSLFATTDTSSQTNSRDGAHRRSFPGALLRLWDRLVARAPSLWGCTGRAVGSRLVTERG